MLSIQDRQVAEALLPRFYQDELEPFPILEIGCTIFRSAGISPSFPGLRLDPASLGASLIVEYAIYFDYDIQHLYDLEHAWVAADADGNVIGCWNSFHGMRLCASGVDGLYRTEDGRPVLYLQPGKHALMPDPVLFGLHPDSRDCCTRLAGGGLLVPPMLRDAMHTDTAQNARIDKFIREKFAFEPSWHFVPETIVSEQLTDCDTLLRDIPVFVRRQLDLIF